jgi:outer membrane protein assembly factor BamB
MQAAVRCAGGIAAGALLAVAAMPGASISGFAAGNYATTGDQAVAYQLNPTHSASLTNDTLAPPLARGWSVNLGALVSYPLIANGHVFVTAGDNNSSVKLYALNLGTGATAWGPISLGSSRPWANATYENGRVFTVNWDGKMQAFDENTGSILWTTQLPGQYAFSSPPTGSNGIVYSGGAGSGGTLYAVRESDGTVLWTSSVMNGDDSSPAVTSTGVYVSYACAQTYDFNPSSGALIWHHSTFCSGGGGKTPVLGNGQLFVRDAPSGNVILDPANGNSLGTFGARPAPALAGSRGYFVNNGTLTAIDLSTNATLWTFTGDGVLSSAPIVVNGIVYVGSSNGNLYAVDQGGNQVWTANVGTAINAPDEQNVSQPLTGLGAGYGYLLVPAGTTLSLYGGQEALYPGDASWGSQPVGQAATPPAPFTLIDNTLSTLQITGIAVSGDFSQTNNCPMSLSPGTSCIINVTFQPSTSGSRTGTLTVTDNAAGSPHVIPLSGTGAPAAPGYLVVSPSPATITAGGAQAFRVEQFDGAGTDLGDVTSATTFTISPSGSCAANSCTATDAMARYAVTASYAGMSTQASLTVTAGPAIQLTIAPASATVPAGTWVNYTVSGADQFGNAIDPSAATYAIAPDGTCSGTGTASCNATKAGPHTVTVSLSGKLASASLTITPGPEYAIRMTPANVTITAGASQPFGTQSFDMYGNLVADVTGSTIFTISPSGSCAANACTATSAGYLYTVTATYGSKSAAVNMNITAGPFDHIVISPSSASIMVGHYQSFSVFGVDQYGNPAIDASSTTFAIAPDGSCSVGSGSASCTVTAAGPHSLTATLSGKSATASLTVDPGPAIRIRIAPIISSMPVATSQAFTARTVDGYENTIADVTSSTTFAFAPNGSCSGNVCTAPTQATTNGTVTGNYNGLTDLVNVAVTAGPVDHIFPSPAASSMTAGQGQAYSVLAYDRYNNYVGDVTSASTFAISPDGSCAGATCTATKAGAHTVTTTYQGKTFGATLTVSPGVTAQLSISPASATVVAGGTKAYTAAAADQYGNSLGDVTSSTVFWVDVNTAACSQNVCSSTKAGSHQVIGSYQSIQATSALTVNPGPATALAVSPATVTIAVSQTASLTANATDAYGNAVGTSTVAWSLGSGTPGTISPTLGSSTVFTASATVSSTGKVVAKLGTLTASSAVSVVPAAPAKLTATAREDRKINLSWSAAPGAASYIVYRSSGTSGWVVLKSGINSTSYTDGGLTAGKTYSYYVIAVGKSGLQSTPSPTVSAVAKN